MTKIYQPHDKVFRAALSNIRVAREFLSYYLPQHLRNVFNLDTMVLQSQTFIDSQLQRTQSDVLYQAQINDNEKAYIYFLLEHWSTPKPLTPFYVQKYNINILDAYLKQNPDAKKLPLIVNLVFFNGKTPYTFSTDFKDLLDAPKELVDQIWNKPLTLIDVSTIPDEIVKTHLWVGILTFFMKHIWARDFLPYLKKVAQELLALERMGAGDYVLSLLNYAFDKGETSNVDEFVDIVKQTLSDTTGEEIMTMAQQLLERGMQQGIQQGVQQGMQQGMQQGIQQGMQQGMQQGECALLLRLLQRKFHNIPEPYLERMAKADAGTLLEWGERILDAKDLDDVFD